MAFLASHLIASAAAFGQTAFGFRPSLTVSQLHDSNLFFAPSAMESDFITRVSPEIETELRSPLLTLTAGYGLDAEHYADHAELSRSNARQHALAGISYRASERTTLSTSGAFVTTRTPGELLQETGLGLVRAFAQRLEARSSMSHRINPVTTGAVDYTFTEERIEGGPGIRTHGATLTTDRRVSERDVVNTGYRYRQFIFGRASSSSHGLSLGWTRSISRRTAVVIAGGPNVTGDSTGLDLAASLRNRFKGGDLSFAYARTQTTVFGLPDVVQTQSVSTTAAWTLGRSLQVRLAPALYQSRRQSLRADVVRFTASIVCPVSRQMSVELSLDGSRQRGLLFAGVGNVMIPRYQTTISLVAGSRVESR